MTVHAPTELRARDLMTTDLLTVSMGTSASELARFLGEHEISGAPVVSEDGKPVGVVSTVDLARLASERPATGPGSGGSFYRAPVLEEEISWELYGMEEQPGTDEGWGEIVVEDFMTTAIQSVPDTMPIAEVAGLMVAGHYHRLLVERDGSLVGIVTSMDLLRVLAEEGVRA